MPANSILRERRHHQAAAGSEGHDGGQGGDRQRSLDPDVSGHASNVEMGTLQFHVIVRGERVGIRLKDTESAAVRNFHGLIFYPLGHELPRDGDVGTRLMARRRSKFRMCWAT